MQTEPCKMPPYFFTQTYIKWLLYPKLMHRVLLVLLMLFMCFPASADIVMLAHITFQGQSSTTITPPAGWTLIRTDSSGTGAGASNSAIYYRVADSSDNSVTSYSFTFSSSVRYAGGIVAYDGVNGTSPIGANAGQAGSGTTLAAPSVTAAVNDWVVRFFGHAYGGAAINTPTGPTQRYADFTSAGPNGSAGLAADRLITTAGATGILSTTDSNSAPNTGQTVIIKPLSGLNISFLGAASTNSGGPTGGSIDIPKPGSVVVTIDHIRILHDGIGLTCSPETVTVRACADSTCASLYTGTVTTTLSPAGWVGGNTISFSGGSTTAQLRKTTTGFVTLSAGSTSPTPTNTSRCFIGATETCSMEFKDSGFIFTVPTQTAYKTSSAITITAVRKDITTQTCAPAFTGSKGMYFWFNYSNPATGTRQLNVNGTALPTSVPGTSNINLTFDANAQSTFTVKYNDAGQLQLNARYIGTGAESGLVMDGNNQFVTVPAGLCVESTDAGSTCASGDATCSKFTAAGALFNLTVRAVGWEVDGETNSQFCTGNGDTPNFLLNNIVLNPTLIAPATGTNGVLSVTSLNMIAGNNGNVTLNNQTIDEVGVFTVTATPPAYLGQTIAASRSANIGRFIPDRFMITDNSAVAGFGFVNSCTAGTNPFTYQDQPFYYNIAPQLTITALNTNGNVTDNYGDTNPTNPAQRFWKLTTTLGRNYTDTAGAAATFTSILDTDVTLAGDLDYDGTGTLTLDSGTNGDTFTYARVSEEGEFNANVDLRFSGETAMMTDDLKDDDGVCYDPDDNGVCDDYVISGLGGAILRFGRLVLLSAAGSELLPVAIPLRAEYFDGTGFVTNTDDSCTQLTLASDILLTNPETAGGVPQAGTSTMNVGAGTSMITSGNAVFTDGVSSLTFSAPGQDNTGYIDVLTDLSVSGLDYLQDDLDDDGVYAEDPSGRVTFGVYEGHRTNIYMREPW